MDFNEIGNNAKNMKNKKGDKKMAKNTNAAAATNAGAAVAIEKTLADGRKVTLKPLNEIEPVLYIKPNEMTEGQNVSGTLERVRESEYKGKPTFTYYIRIDDGSLVGLNGAGHLNWFMQTQFNGGAVPVGAYVSITYLGMSDVKEEGHQFSVSAGLPDSGDAAEAL